MNPFWFYVLIGLVISLVWSLFELLSYTKTMLLEVQKIRWAIYHGANIIEREFEDTNNAGKTHPPARVRTVS